MNLLFSSFLTGCFLIMKVLSNKLIWIVISTLAFTNLAAASYIYVLFLGPTCGRDYGKYQAGDAGINLALKDLQMSYSNESFVNSEGQLISLVRFSPSEIAIDGGCELIRKWLLSKRQFVLLGGGCSCTTKYTMAPSFLPDVIPQITFDAVYTDSLELTRTLMMVPMMPIGLKEVIEYLVNGINSQHKSRVFGLIYDSDGVRSLELRSTARQIITSIGARIEVELSSNGSDLVTDMHNSRLRHFVVLLPLSKLKDLVCLDELRSSSQAGRYLLAAALTIDEFNIIANYSASFSDKKCELLTDNSGPALRFSVYNQNTAAHDFFEKHQTVIGGLDETIVTNVYQSTMILIRQLNMTRNVDNLTSEILEKSPWSTAAGNVTFNNRQRWIPLKIMTYGGSPPSTDRLILIEDLDRVPLWVFILTSLLTVVCLILTFTIMIWNICHSSDRMVKMTSPQINIVICIGSLLACLCVPLDGLSTFMTSVTITALTKSLIFCVLPMASTLVFGSTALKLWRIYAIFSNINVKRRNTKDRCLLLLLSIPVLFDLALTITVVIFDSIKCELRPTSQIYQQSVGAIGDIVRQRSLMVCGNRFWWIWVLVIYIVKIPLGLVAIYFAWRIRHVTLTSLREGNRVFLIVSAAWGFSLLALPVFLSAADDCVHPSVQHAVFAITILFPLITFLKLHFLSKIKLLRQLQKKSVSHADKYKFSESFRATQDSLTAEEDRMEQIFGRCFHWFKTCGRRSDEDDDASVTSNNILLNEISNLKRTLQEKDKIIRDLTDRLFYGYHKYQNEETAIGLSQSSNLQHDDIILNDPLADCNLLKNMKMNQKLSKPFRPARPLRSYSLASFAQRCEYMHESDSALEPSPCTSEKTCVHCGGSTTAVSSTISNMCFKESPFSPHHVNVHI